MTATDTPAPPEPHYPPLNPPDRSREAFRANGGWSAIRKDWRHFCRVHRADTPFQRLMVALSSRSLWALAVYRYGRWAYSVRSRPISLPARVAYQVLYLWGQYTSKVAIDIYAEIADEVFMGPLGLLFIGPDVRIGRGSFIHGQSTLGIGGRPGARGLPMLGDRVHVGPGSTLVGPIAIPDDTVIGPNSVVARTLPASGGWIGSPAKPYPGPTSDLIPSWAGTWRIHAVKR